MLFKESETVELKQTVIDDIKKEIVAFANSGGGILYIGIADDGDVIGLSNTEADIMNINNMVRDGIKPDVTLFTKSSVEEIDGRNIIKIEVQSGTERPYYLTGKGIRPEGVYVRHGTSSVPATDTAIRKMIRETDGESYEKLRSTEQELLFVSAKDEFARRGIQFEAAQISTLGLSNTDNIYTNLGLLLSDQCVHTVKTAIFQDTTQQIFKDRREFGGSLFSQINDVYNYLDMHNKTESTFDKLLRIDKRDYPETALREALLNAVVHREYAVSGSILVKMFSDRIEFISPGGLVSGIELGDIMSGYSACRNSALAAVFYRLQLIEAYGTGILKIFESYKTSLRQPKIEVTPNIFKIILPNLNVQIGDDFANSPLTPQELILGCIREQGYISRKQAEQLLGISQTATGVILRKMVENGILSKVGNSRNVHYIVSK